MFYLTKFLSREIGVLQHSASKGSFRHTQPQKEEQGHTRPQ